jgi:beta-lactamase regulating signal transducer with metallopeptidase domain
MLVDLLINWAWQGCAVTLAAWAIVRVAHPSATAKYQIWWSALLLVLLLPVIPVLLALVDVPAIVGTESSAPVAEIPIPRPARWPVLAAAGVWAAGAVISLVRALRAHAALARMRSAARAFPASREKSLRNWMRLRGTGRPARLVISDDVRAAAVLGLASPLIAVSSAAERTLSDDELDRVLVHEWAHVQRRDDVARLAQVVIRGLAWMHPAVIAIDRQLDIEREVACDDWVVNQTGSPRDLARCLTRVAEISYSAAGLPLAPGAVAGTSLSVRVRRLLDAGRSTTTRSSLVKLAPLAATLAGIALSVSGVQLVGVASSVTVPVPHRVARLAGSLNPDGDARLLARRWRHVDVTTRPAAAPGKLQGTASAASKPQAVDAPHIPGPVAVEPLASLPGARTTWAPPEPSIAPSTMAARVEEIAPESGASNDAAGTPWGAATVAGLSVAHGSQRAADAAADAGTSIGRGSQHAATATAGLFTRFGRRIAGSF